MNLKDKQNKTKKSLISLHVLFSYSLIFFPSENIYVEVNLLCSV